MEVRPFVQQSIFSRKGPIKEVNHSEEHKKSFMCKIINIMPSRGKSLGIGFLKSGGNEIVFDKALDIEDRGQSSFNLIGKSIIISVDPSMILSGRSAFESIQLDDDMSAISMSERLHTSNGMNVGLVGQGFNICGNFSVHGSNVDVETIDNSSHDL